MNLIITCTITGDFCRSKKEHTCIRMLAAVGEMSCKHAGMYVCFCITHGTSLKGVVDVSLSPEHYKHTGVSRLTPLLLSSDITQVKEANSAGDSE